MRAGKIRIAFENPNTPEETCEYLSKLFAQRMAENQLKESPYSSKSRSTDKNKLNSDNISL